MIPKALDEISEEDLRSLISNAVLEGRTIDYKRELPGGDDAGKREFLADVSSFANTSGGDLIFGMDESQGAPTQIAGFKCSDIDIETQRLENILASGLAPRIRARFRVITSKEDRMVLVVRVEHSWTGPHRVIFKGHDKFYGRNSSGKYPLDVNELRSAFTLSSTVAERIRAFRTDRIISLSNNETPVPFKSGPKIVLHCIPVDSFATRVEYNLLPLYRDATRLEPMRSSGWGRRLKLDGLVAFTGDAPSRSYAQLYRNGTIEAVEGSLLSPFRDQKLLIPSVAYEEELLKYVPRYVGLLQVIGCNVPIMVGLTLTNVRGFRMAIRDWFGTESSYEIDRDTLLLPEAIVTDFSTSATTMMKPIFDLVWNACGHPSSKNFDGNGNWAPPR